MNPLNINQIKVGKAKAIKLRYKKLRKITKFFRVFEIFLVFAVISRLSFQLPIALFKFCIHSLSTLLVSPQFVFIVGNAIVITLLMNSGKLNNEEYKIKTRKATWNDRKIMETSAQRQGITDENAMMAMIFSTPEHQVIKIYQRSKSEKIIRRENKKEKKCCGLRRSNTEIRSLKTCGCYKDPKEGQGHFPEDHMSNEEFQKTIENFIAKQQRILREEELVLCT